MKFYKCNLCGKIILILNDVDTSTVCCGEKMSLVEPKTADMSTEKHVPVIEQNGEKVRVYVGSTEHPMLENHYIPWIILETTNGFQKKDLKPGEKPEAEFVLAEGEKVVAAYEYCNLHDIWVNRI